MASPKPKPKAVPQVKPKATPSPGAKAAASQQKAATAGYNAQQARNSKTSTPGRSPIVSAQTGFTTGTRAVARTRPKPVGKGYQQYKMPATPTPSKPSRFEGAMQSADIFAKRGYGALQISKKK